MEGGEGGDDGERQIRSTVWAMIDDWGGWGSVEVGVMFVGVGERWGGANARIVVAGRGGRGPRP